MSDNLRDDLQAALGRTYTLDRELGGGGMSRVFLAEESRLGRKVVVKVLLPELAAGVSADRFEREIKVAAQLAHPSIVPLLATGEANRLPYYTMPFVQGESLRARIAKGPLECSDVANILRDIARALAYAHERGIVHRDIKPENVLLASGAALVTDFGIAKAISVSRTEAGFDTLTHAGTSVGTPAYMAPEQALGDPATDSRADIYAFGCVAYELLTGRPPFHGRVAHKMIAAHMGEVPPDLLRGRPDCPPALAAFVMRCLEKDPEHRPQSALDVLPALEGVNTPAENLSPKGRKGADNKRSITYIAIAVGILAIVAAGGVAAYRGNRVASEPQTAPVQSIAVLPFTNMDGDTANTYFADGMAEELATSLSKVPGLRVVARNSAFRSFGKQVEQHEAGKVLNVDALLTGSVRRSGGQLRLTARLIGVKDESVLWADQFDREVKDVFAVQDEITRSIVGAISGRLANPRVAGADSAAQPASARETSDLEAHDLYLRAQFHLRRRAIPLSIEYFKRAIARDSSYARAYSGLSAALELIPYFVGHSAESVRGPAMAAANRALALDPSLSEAHTSLALAFEHAHQWKESEREHLRAIQLDPGDAAAHVQYARYLLAVGNTKQAYDEARRAEALDPFSPVIASWVSYSLMRLGMVSEALAAAKRGFELDSGTAPMINVAAHVHLHAGEKARAISMVDRLPRLQPWPGYIAYIHAMAGDTVTAHRVIREIESRPKAWSASSAAAWGYLGLKDTTRALSALERATDNGDMWYFWYSLADPIYDPVRATERFAALVRRVGLDENLFTTRRK